MERDGDPIQLQRICRHGLEINKKRSRPSGRLFTSAKLSRSVFEAYALNFSLARRAKSLVYVLGRSIFSGLIAGSKLASAFSAVRAPSSGMMPSNAIASRTLANDARYKARSPSR